MKQMHTLVRHGIVVARGDWRMREFGVHAGGLERRCRRSASRALGSGPPFSVQVWPDTLRDHQIDAGWALSQFGWQFEKRIKTSPTGLSAVNEWVVLAGGLEQGIVIPSLSWLVGLRTGSGVEFGLGPNVTPAGVALVAGGVTVEGRLNVPFNVAVVPSRAGMRVSVLTGFNMKR